MTKEDINSFHDHGEYVSINLTPYYTAKSVGRSMFFGMFLGTILGAVVGILLFTYFIK